MIKYIKITAMILALVIVLSGVSLIGASAEESVYIQPEKFIYGDVDLDGKVTVKDATLVQKDLAKITYATAVQKYLADPEGTGYSVKNATAIQKYLAKYEASPLFGTELVMASQDEFSKNISLEYDFTDNLFIVTAESKKKIQYTIQDFPELNLKSIELIADIPELNIKIYTLYLETPGKDNILEAIKALDYRANIDIKWADPNYIYILDI